MGGTKGAGAAAVVVELEEVRLLGEARELGEALTPLCLRVDLNPVAAFVLLCLLLLLLLNTSSLASASLAWAVFSASAKEAFRARRSSGSATAGEATEPTELAEVGEVEGHSFEGIFVFCKKFLFSN